MWGPLRLEPPGGLRVCPSVDEVLILLDPPTRRVLMLYAQRGARRQLFFIARERCL
jgi:hypothetical protein